MTDTTSARPIARLAASTTGASRNVLIIDGQYASIGARGLAGGKIDFKLLRSELEALVGAEFSECWYFDHEPISSKSAYQSQNPFISALKLAPPLGPQFQVKMYAMKKYKCHCPSCGHNFTQHVQKGVDNGLATKMLSLAYEDMADRIVLFAGDGDFYDTLDLVKNVRRKDLWVVGYRDSVSADLQQLASKVVWMESLPNITLAAAAPTARRGAPSPRGAPVPPVTPHTVHVGKLPGATTEAILLEAFEYCGPMLSMRLHADRGFCFIDFPTTDAADLAKQRASETAEASRAVAKRPHPVEPSALQRKKQKKKATKTMTSRVSVHGLVPGTTERDVRALFGPFGAIDDVQLESGQSPARSCYITFQDEASVAMAKVLNGSRRHDLVLRVETAKLPKAPSRARQKTGAIHETPDHIVDLVDTVGDDPSAPSHAPPSRSGWNTLNHEVINLCVSDDDDADDQDTDDDSDF
ncbi:hypothetical protein SPRG_06017 [Saprolegnia parasitica CBS 223.65]|uniref:Meiosis regulator and mRNA stability factor 1 n=1 Tax=Saprolegnia parasitica (strain CBS 223.65) TaxID=695850 RepID=A0A067CG35_SAPPC|nr:hypothetical protein SPRG_06017 [Saprolegnia parasitica CBS 223.65]KDO29478.1 hypothetical protein SPRG_06017 [Saprolegnia parasitica CBS 223.65]|eukprot:XP_012199975.1 hypothetical protein SPRG_06017 [Saprolegnia parasitica CBS 223.65]